MNIIIATHNQGKVREMNFLFKEFIPQTYNINLLSLNDNNYSCIPEIVEDGNSFKANAIKKATLTANYTEQIVIADDSGLVVDALNGEPGIFSSRYAGENATDEGNIEKLLEKLNNVPKDFRTAHFVCVIAIAAPDNLIGTFEGKCYGMIGTEIKGNNGFGYDPVFIRTDSGKTFAELPHDVKNKISHRARAFEKASATIEKYIK
ncbi:MAG: non-canonical purine NTP pyrophosphatase [Chlamydiae bacterium]|nr:MAG: non-canonical purine NTP pyrophosphatase [Chlamydiota bacterium]